MLTWTLIIMLFPNQGNVPNPTIYFLEGFGVESQCSDAGNKLLQSHRQSPQNRDAGLNFVCVKKGKL